MLSLYNQPYTLASSFRHWPHHIENKVHVSPIRIEQLEIMSTEDRGNRSKHLHICQVYANTCSAPSAEGHQVVCQRVQAVRTFRAAQPPLRLELERVGEDGLVCVHVVCVHADGNARRYLRVAVPPDTQAVDSREPLDLAVAEA